MKHCPECNRNYADPTVSFCLTDGAPLIFGPAVEEPETAFLSSDPPSEAATRTFEPFPTSGQSYPQIAKNRRWIPIGVAILFLAAAGIGGYLFYVPNPSKQIESIAVMPFANESGNLEMEYLSDGLTDAVIGSLSQLSEISVKARSSVFRYKGKNADTATLAKELGVQAVLNGRVVQRGDSVSLFVELIDATSEKILWSENYNRPMTNLVSLQADIAKDVSLKLRSRLSTEQQQQLAKTFTRNPEAYKLYLQGRFHWNKRSQENIKKAIEYFDQAIALDSNYALAYSGLADAYTVSFESYKLDARESRIKARQAAEKALRLDESLAEAHASLAPY